MEDDKRPTIADGPMTFDLDDHTGALIGADVGGYVIEAELGHGGMGVVYAATHPVIGKRAAIKVLKPSLSNNPATVERFLQEARSVNQIGHPNIVDIFAFGTLPDGRSYLVMDLLEGEPLRKRVKRGRLPVHEAATLIDEIASALAAAHDKGFIHRDLKPDNVFLVAHPGRYDVRLLDFGLAKLAPNATTARAFRTATGAQIGTPDYMSPEQLRGAGVDHRTDIYALGVVAFEILSGGRPRRRSDGTFELGGLTIRQSLQKVRGVTSDLAELVEAMMAPEVQSRPSLTAVRTVLKRIRPSLRMNAATPPAALPIVRAIGTEPSSDAMSPSMFGARPVVPTPLSGTPTAPLASQPSPDAGDSMSEPPIPVWRRAPTQPPTMAPPPILQPPVRPRSQPSQPPAVAPSAGLRIGSTGAGATKLGVAPPPERRGTPHPMTSAPRAGDRKLWLVIVLALVVAAAVALVAVLAT